MILLPEDISKELSETVAKLSAFDEGSIGFEEKCPEGLPSLDDIKEIIDILWKVIFPELFIDHNYQPSRIDYHIGIATDRLFQLMRKQITIGLSCHDVSHYNVTSDDKDADRISLEIIGELPEIRRKLYTDIQAIMQMDPAAGSEIEIILCYPSVKAILHHRFAHLLFRKGIPYLPRVISELAHTLTGIDIHPGATIGEYFAIDHGTGVVIGETCIIGKGVTIYQGVTLGAKSFRYDEKGKPLNVPRHPIIEDNVTIYSNASVLGRIKIGHDTVIGGNVWVTNDVPPYSRIVQGTSREEVFNNGAGI